MTNSGRVGRGEVLFEDADLGVTESEDEAEHAEIFAAVQAETGSEADVPTAEGVVVQVIQGDARVIPLQENIVDLVVTSPPYWKKRDYRVPDQIGQEALVDDYVGSIVTALSEWRRVLRPTGSVFLNIGDTYDKKSLAGVPARVEHAARDDGWIVRNRIIWAKAGGMPEPAQNRLANRHEYILHLTVGHDYYYDMFGYAARFGNGANPGDIWNVALTRGKGTHLAPFPEEIVERAITLACPGRVCALCGEPSGGPNTREGKEIARWNATRHGIRSPAPVVPGVEKAEEWEGHRDGVLDSLSPVGHLEFVLAERAALLSWRLHRVIRYETESIALFQERVEDDLARERRFETGPDHPEAVRGNAKSDEQDYKLLKRFLKMKDDKRLSSIDADIIIWGAMECTDKVVEGEVDPEELLESVSVPGLPNSDSWEGYEGWTAGLVRAVVEAIAKATDEEPEELLEAATRDARFKMERTKREAEKVERDLRNMARERLLPDEKTLEKVARYEAHLSRGLYKALHELEALQVRRTGGAAPLARLDVDGLAGS